MDIDKQIEEVLSNPEKRTTLIRAMIGSGVFDNIKTMVDNDFSITYCAYIDSSIQASNSLRETTTKFSEMEDYNNFETVEEAHRYALSLDAMHKLRLIANYLNQGWQPDWSTKSMDKYCIYWNHESRVAETEFLTKLQYGTIFFKNAELCNKAIEMMGEQSLKELFMVDAK